MLHIINYMNKAIFKRILRNLGIIRLSDNLRYQVMKFKNKKDNKAFVKQNPNLAIPPDYLMYEAHQLKYRSYFENGLSNTKKIKALFEKYIDFEGKKVLDWGCGPARIIRHFPSLAKNTKFYGTDYNKETITWNSKNIDNVSFYTNSINPPTSFDNDYFDIVYGLSIFTHLSEENHINWINELARITKSGAILLLTTHGEIFKQKLIKKDLIDFENNKLVVQGNTLEGHRTYAAFHPPKLMREYFNEKFEILEHIPGTQKGAKISQDQWVLKTK